MVLCDGKGIRSREITIEIHILYFGETYKVNKLLLLFQKTQILL